MNRTQCICGSPLKLEGFSENFDTLCCPSCRSQHFVGKQNASATEFRYDGDNEKYAEESYLCGSTLRWSHHVLLKRQWDRRKVLEIGCFNGFFLAELRKAGASVYGFDVNPAAVAAGKKLFALDQLHTSLDALASFGPYDDIVCIDVIEHLDSPEALLAQLSAMLTPEGLLHVAGPTIERGLHDKSDYPPHHKWWFSRDGLTKFLRSAGFRVDQVLVQRDAVLMLRNWLGKLVNGRQQREFRGEAMAFAPATDGAVLGPLYRAATLAGIAIFTVLRISYCSTVMVARRSPQQ